MDIANHHDNLFGCDLLFTAEACEKVARVTIPLFSYRVDCFWPNGCPDTCDRWMFIGLDEARKDLERLEQIKTLVLEQYPHLKNRMFMQIEMMEEGNDDE
jgi:hypothetical protein